MKANKRSIKHTTKNNFYHTANSSKSSVNDRFCMGQQWNNWRERAKKNNKTAPIRKSHLVVLQQNGLNGKRHARAQRGGTEKAQSKRIDNDTTKEKSMHANLQNPYAKLAVHSVHYSIYSHGQPYRAYLFCLSMIK